MAEADAIVVGQTTDHVRMAAETRLAQGPEDAAQAFARHLQHRPQLFVEKRRHRIPAQLIQLDVYTGVPGKGHFAYGRKQSAVRAVVIGDHEAELIQRLDHVKKQAQDARVIHVRRFVTKLIINLRQRRAAEPIFFLAQIDQQQIGLAAIAAQFRCQGLAHIHHRAEARDDQRQRRRDRVFSPLGVLPHRLHGQRVLADRDRDPQRRAEL